MAGSSDSPLKLSAQMKQSIIYAAGNVTGWHRVWHAVSATEPLAVANSGEPPVKGGIRPMVQPVPVGPVHPAAHRGAIEQTLRRG